jgi:hypothetical protein
MKTIANVDGKTDLDRTENTWEGCGSVGLSARLSEDFYGATQKGK